VVGFLGGFGRLGGSDAATLGGALQRRCLRLVSLGLAAFADQLLDRGHRLPSRAPMAGSSSDGAARRRREKGGPEPSFMLADDLRAAPSGPRVGEHPARWTSAGPVSPTPPCRS